MKEVTFLQMACGFLLGLNVAVCVFIWHTWRQIKEMDKNNERK